MRSARSIARLLPFPFQSGVELDLVKVAEDEALESDDLLQPVSGGAGVGVALRGLAAAPPAAQGIAEQAERRSQEGPEKKQIFYTYTCTYIQ